MKVSFLYCWKPLQWNSENMKYPPLSPLIIGWSEYGIYFWLTGGAGSTGPGKRGTYLHHYCTPLGNSAASRYYMCVESGSYSRDGISCTAAGEARIVLPTAATGCQHWCTLNNVVVSQSNTFFSSVLSHNSVMPCN